MGQTTKILEVCPACSSIYLAKVVPPCPMLVPYDYLMKVLKYLLFLVIWDKGTKGTENTIEELELPVRYIIIPYIAERIGKYRPCKETTSFLALLSRR